MITVDVCWIEDIDDQNINVAKCILKLKQAKAFSGSDTWIRTNPNYVKSLEKVSLIQKNENNKNFVQLTKKGEKIKIFQETINMTLEEYFRAEKDIEGVIETCMMISVTSSSYKINHTTCHSCNKTKTNLSHYVDHDGNDGMYCGSCLHRFGYMGSVYAANKRRTEARNAFSLR
jgi:predicted transcriptional regulator